MKIITMSVPCVRTGGARAEVRQGEPGRGEISRLSFRFKVQRYSTYMCKLPVYRASHAAIASTCWSTIQYFAPNHHLNIYPVSVSGKSRFHAYRSRGRRMSKYQYCGSWDARDAPINTAAQAWDRRILNSLFRLSQTAVDAGWEAAVRMRPAASSRESLVFIVINGHEVSQK